MTASEHRERELARIREAGAARARRDPPLTERQLERLAFLIAPAVATPRTAPKQPVPLADAA